MKTALLFWRRIVTYEHFWPLVVVLFFGWLASRALFGYGYFNMHDDLQIMRQIQMEKCILDLQIPCRWVPDMGYGFGFPLFNYYPPLPYLIGMLVRLVGYSFIDTAKALFIIAFMASGVSMYFFAKEFFKKLGGVVSAVFYIWAPYHSVDIYVRGAMNESWALIFFPLVLLFIYKVIKERKLLNILTLSLSLFGLLTSHNLMVLIFAPIAITWALFWIIRLKSWGSTLSLGVSGIFGLGLAAFFTLPVTFEQRLVHADTLVKGYFEFTAHFVTTNQLLISRYWGYGPSVWMHMDDKMSFQIGQIHWMLASILAVVAVTIVFRHFRQKQNSETLNKSLIVLLFVTIGWVAAFMTHSKSTPLWQAFKPLEFVQFPWRFLTLVIFAFSFVAGWIANVLPKRITVFVVSILLLSVVILNFEFFLPEHGKLGPLTDEEKTSGAAWELQRTAGIYDYLPIAAKENPKEGYREVATVIEGNVVISETKLGTNWAYFKTKSEEQSEIRLNIYQFPNWKTFIDGVEVENYVPEKEPWGRMHVEVPAGEHGVYAKLYNTPIRTVGNIISLLSWGLIVLILVKKRVRLG